MKWGQGVPGRLGGLNSIPSAENWPGNQLGIGLLEIQIGTLHFHAKSIVNICQVTCKIVQ